MLFLFFVRGATRARVVWLYSLTKGLGKRKKAELFIVALVCSGVSETKSPLEGADLKFSPRPVAHKGLVVPSPSPSETNFPSDTNLTGI